MEQIARHPVRPEQWEGEQPYQGLVEQIEESQTGSQTEQLSVAIITAEVKGEDQEHGGGASAQAAKGVMPDTAGPCSALDRRS